MEQNINILAQPLSKCDIFLLFLVFNLTRKDLLFIQCLLSFFTFNIEEKNNPVKHALQNSNFFHYVGPKNHYAFVKYYI